MTATLHQSNLIDCINRQGDGLATRALWMPCYQAAGETTLLDEFQQNDGTMWNTSQVVALTWPRNYLGLGQGDAAYGANGVTGYISVGTLTDFLPAITTGGIHIDAVALPTSISQSRALFGVNDGTNNIFARIDASTGKFRLSLSDGTDTLLLVSDTAVAASQKSFMLSAGIDPAGDGWLLLDHRTLPVTITGTMPTLTDPSQPMAICAVKTASSFNTLFAGYLAMLRLDCGRAGTIGDGFNVQAFAQSTITHDLTLGLTYP